jgi:hypothetical protein
MNLKKSGKVFTSKFVWPGPSSDKKKTLPGRGLTKVEKHCSRLQCYGILTVVSVSTAASSRSLQPTQIDSQFFLYSLIYHISYTTTKEWHQGKDVNKANGTEPQERKWISISNLKEEQFCYKSTYPGGGSKFSIMHSKIWILAQYRTRSVCVCIAHQNVKFTAFATAFLEILAV